MIWKNISLKTNIFGPLIVFSLIMFFVSLGDGIMSYVTPIFIEEHLKDPFLVGLVLSVSSFFGIFFDIWVGEKLSLKPYKFFIIGTILIAFLFPLNLLILPKSIASFVLAMFIWSAYYELRNYSKYNFIHKFSSPEHHTLAFSTTSTFQSLAYMAGPAAAVYLIGKTFNFSFYATILAIAIAGIIYLFFLQTFKSSKEKDSTNAKKKSLVKELKVLKVLLHRLWPILLFSFAITILDVSFWTTGILYAEELREASALGGLFMVIYGLPAVFVGVITPMIQKKYENLGKKRISFIGGILCGVSLALIGTTSNVPLILTAVFIASTFYGIISILVEAVFEDYVARLREEGNDLVSANQISINLAYAVGPIILGFISKYFDFGATFIMTGFTIVLSAIIALIVVPRKIKMPQKELAEVVEG